MQTGKGRKGSNQREPKMQWNLQGISHCNQKIKYASLWKWIQDGQGRLLGDVFDKESNVQYSTILCKEQTLYNIRWMLMMIILLSYLKEPHAYR